MISFGQNFFRFRVFSLRRSLKIRDACKPPGPCKRQNAKTDLFFSRAGLQTGPKTPGRYDKNQKSKNTAVPRARRHFDLPKIRLKKERCEAHNHALRIFLKSFYPLRPVRQRTGRRLKSYDAFPERPGFHVKRRTVLLSLSLHCKIDPVCIRAF